MEINYRLALARDAMEIAALHARSWQVHYRGSFSDAYLDGPVIPDRQEVWRHRLQHPPSNQYCLVAETRERIVGLLCLYLKEDPHYGSYIDNLHVDPEHQGLRIGKTLMAKAADWLELQAPGVPYYLWVLAVNSQAIGFYKAIGGRNLETAEQPHPDGGHSICCRFVWNTNGLKV